MFSVKRLKLDRYKALKNIDIDFDDRLTVIVGKNGAGKTSTIDFVSLVVCDLLAMKFQQDGQMIYITNQGRSYEFNFDLLLTRDELHFRDTGALPGRKM